MNINYQDLEKKVYEWLMARHEADPAFCFSTRQKAAKGAEKDYFIGTHRSGYFATTFWWIPISFPGSSTDLINLIFKLQGGKYKAYLQFCQTRAPYNKQNELALQFIQELKPVLKDSGIAISFENSPEKKMEYYDIELVANQDNISNFSELDHRLDKIFPVIDGFLAAFKNEHLDFDAGRVDANRFNNIFQRRLHERLERPLPPEIVTEKEEEPDLSVPLVTARPPYALNTILYGPPGTGKTYNVIEMAVEIADPAYYQENKTDRELVHRRFAELSFKEIEKESDAQIAFCTFHQSMSYEDFIEGIKPKMNGTALEYEIQDGLFKRIADLAAKNYLSSLKDNTGKEDFDAALRQLIDHWELDKNMKFNMKTKGSEFTITQFTNSSIRYKKASGGEGHTLSLETLKQAYYGTRAVRQTGVGIYYPGVLEKLSVYKRKAAEPLERKNYVLVIDEINRGNVSQIFGELITALEPSKRLGDKKEQIDVLLPYSKVAFAVPPNLFVVGTMNTADRSVEALDTALRRRFTFKEIMPDAGLISEAFKKDFLDKCVRSNAVDWDEETWKKIELQYLDVIPAAGYERFKALADVCSLEELTYERYDELWEEAAIELLTVGILETVNERIEVLLGRDHLIGHSYLMGIYTYDAIKEALYQNIIPLLQEYFFGDYGKIGLVLGEAFIRTKYNESNQKVNFANFKYSEKAGLQRTVYQLVPKEDIKDMPAVIAKLLNRQAEK